MSMRWNQHWFPIASKLPGLIVDVSSSYGWWLLSVSKECTRSRSPDPDEKMKQQLELMEPSSSPCQPSEPPELQQHFTPRPPAPPRVKENMTLLPTVEVLPRVFLMNHTNWMYTGKKFRKAIFKLAKLAQYIFF